jgi:heme o synthase
MNIYNGCRKSSVINRLSAGQQTEGLHVFGRLVPWLQLTKLPICLLVAFSTLFGTVLAGPAYVYQTVLTTIGMLLLACGSATLNSLQEIHLDASMARTKDRPLPRGRISTDQAALLVILLIVAGLSVLYLGSYLLQPVGLGLVAVILYNLVYTPLKTRTVAAILPGAISGALPPYIGWSAAGGEPFVGTALLLFALFILWQVPHSLLILLRHKEDYLDSDIPSLIKLLPESSLKRILLVWTGAFFTVLLFLTGLPIGLTEGVRLFLRISVIIVFLLFSAQWYYEQKHDYHVLFLQLNLFLFLIMALCIGDRLLLSL